MPLRGPHGSRACSCHWPALGFVVVPLFLLAGQASAARIDAQERAAKKACMTGDAAKGVAILADLFIDTSDPTYIYNQGRCYEQNSRYEDAIGRFREYLRKATSATAEEKADAEKHIADCQALMGKRPDAAVSPAPPPEPVRATPPPPVPSQPAVAFTPEAPLPSLAPKSEPAVPAIATATEHQAAPSAGSGLRVAGLTTGAVGVAALAGGLALNLKHNGMIDDLQGGYDPGDHDSSDTYKTLSIVGYAAGAACVAGGAILYYLGWRSGRVSVAPMPVAGGAGAVLGGAL